MATRSTDHVAAIQAPHSRQIASRCYRLHISNFINPSGTLHLHVGHTGIQVITPLYQRDRVQGPLLSDHLRRWTDTITCPTPTTYEDDDGIDRFEEAFHFNVVDLAWFHPESRRMMERGGKTVWRVMNFFHIDEDFMARPLRIVLGRLIMLCLVDKIDIATGYLGDCALDLQHVLDDLSTRIKEFPKVYMLYEMNPGVHRYVHSFSFIDTLKKNENLSKPFVIKNCTIDSSCSMDYEDSTW